jgi:hypothetical protein
LRLIVPAIRRLSSYLVEIGMARKLFLSGEGRTIWIADAHRGDGQRFVVHADEKLTAFLELERAICLRLLSEQI